MLRVKGHPLSKSQWTGLKRSRRSFSNPTTKTTFKQRQESTTCYPAQYDLKLHLFWTIKCKGRKSGFRYKGCRIRFMQELFTDSKLTFELLSSGSFNHNRALIFIYLPYPQFFHNHTIAGIHRCYANRCCLKVCEKNS